MNRRRSSVTAIIFFLVQAVSSDGISCSHASALNPPTRITAQYFREVYAAVSMAVLIYKFDAIGGNRGEDAINRYAAALPASDIKFDFERIRIPGRGWTRQYPILVRDESFIARIFLTEEKAYQQLLPVLFEMRITNPAITCQILPDINAVLDKDDIKPYRPPSRDQAGTSL